MSFHAPVFRFASILLLTGALVASRAAAPGLPVAGTLPASSRDALATKIPAPGILADKDWFIWGASCAKGDDGRYHLYFDRWRRDNPRGMSGWLYVSEIAHAWAPSPTGPWTVTGTVVAADPKAPPDRWDAVNAHNAMIARMPDPAGKLRYYLYFIVNHDTKATKDDWWNHVLGQRIAMASSDKPEGPFVRHPEPVCAPGGPAHLYVVNPGVCRLPDGRYLMVFKSRDGGPGRGAMIHLWATADRPEGPFKTQASPLFPPSVPAEDPCVWTRDGFVYAAVKDWHGKLAGKPGIAVVRGVIQPGGDIAWDAKGAATVSPRVIRWSDGKSTTLDSLERPFVLADDAGKPSWLFAAAAVENPFVNASPTPRPAGAPPAPDRSLSFNLCVPLETAGSK